MKQNSSQEQQYQMNNDAQPLSEYDRSKYTDYNCYNCGGEQFPNQSNDQKCNVCQGVGKLLRTKDIQTIEYLIEKKLCQLYPELKQIYKQFQQKPDENNSDINPGKKDENKKKNQKNQKFENLFQNPSSQTSKGDQIVPQQADNTDNNININDNNFDNNNINNEEDQSTGKKNENNKKKKKKDKFNLLFSDKQNNNQSPFNNGVLTPSEEDKIGMSNKSGDNMPKSDNFSNIQMPINSNNNIILRGSDEIFAFDVFKYPHDKNEIVFSSDQQQVLDIELKRKSKAWPITKIYVEESDEKYFQNLSETKEYDFSQNEEHQTIQLILKPAQNVSGTVISKWKLFYLDSNNQKKSINGAIPLRATIQ